MDRGRGFVLVRGLRSDHYGDALSAAIFFVVGLHIGKPMRATELGDMMQQVLATSDQTMSDPGAKSTRVRDALNFHSDPMCGVSALPPTGERRRRVEPDHRRSFLQRNPGAATGPRAVAVRPLALRLARAGP
jgi:hypothetical protein